ncbi:hypothetical protein FA95DRAFT_1529483, partial [Auriscalpium vulgare]
MHDLTHPHEEAEYLGLSSHFALQLSVRSPATSAPGSPSPDLYASASDAEGRASEAGAPVKKKAKVKMHHCKLCEKAFPRPSGLRTHMNSHSGDKPYKCPIATCEKSFTVRSNAKRHLRTHGVVPPPAAA